MPNNIAEAYKASLALLGIASSDRIAADAFLWLAGDEILAVSAELAPQIRQRNIPPGLARRLERWRKGVTLLSVTRHKWN